VTTPTKADTITTMSDYGVFGQVDEEDLQLADRPAPNGFSNQLEVRLGQDPPQGLSVPVMNGPLAAPLTMPQIHPDNRGYAFAPSPSNQPLWASGATGSFSTFTGSQETIVPLVLVAGVAIAGGVFYGIWGAGAGALLTGAAINLYRTRSTTPDDSSRHLTFAVLGGAAGGYLAYKAWKSKKGTIVGHE
jgi:hypothetical protein